MEDGVGIRNNIHETDVYLVLSVCQTLGNQPIIKVNNIIILILQMRKQAWGDCHCSESLN